MKILLTSLFCWATALLIVFRIIALALSDRRIRLTKPAIILSILILTAGSVLLLRPHEDIYGGQDQAVYYNMANSMARTGHLFYRDQLLSQIPSDKRTEFLSRLPMRTHLSPAKCMIVTNLEECEIGPWFQPAFPILLSLPAHLHSSLGALYASPVFSLLTAIILWALAIQLLQRPLAGPLAMLFYFMSPIVAWHGRSARAETPCAFFLAAAFLLILHSRGKFSLRTAINGALAMLCLGLAPFFHITGWTGVLPMLALAACLTAAGNRALLTGLPLFICCACAFIYQTLNITDCYELASTFLIAFQLKWVLAMLTITGVAMTLWLCKHTPLQLPKWRWRNRSFEGIAGLFLAVFSAIVLLLLNFSFLPQGSRLCSLLAPIKELRLTDVAKLVQHLSPIVSVAILLGWVAFLTQGQGKKERTWFALCWLPGILLTGHFPISMYFLRRTLPYIVPTIALSLTALSLSAPSLSALSRPAADPAPATRTRLSKYGRIALILLLLGSSVSGRTHLFLQTETRGLTSFIEQFAKRVKDADGILLSEYARLSAPFYHTFGIPTLTIDSDQHREPAEAEAAFASLMHSTVSSNSTTGATARYSPSGTLPFAVDR